MKALHIIAFVTMYSLGAQFLSAAFVQPLEFGINFADLSGDGQTIAFALNPDMANYGLPALWSRHSGISQLPLPPGADAAIVRQISKNASTVVGQVRFEESDHLYVWRDGLGIDLGPFSFSNTIPSVSISDDGGRLLTTRGGISLWEFDATNNGYAKKEVPELRTTAVISGNGLSLLGRSSVDDGWRKVDVDGNVTELGTPPGTFLPVAVAADYDGSAFVGGYPSQSTAWRWDINSGFEELPFEAPNAGRWIDITSDGSTAVFGFPPRFWKQGEGTKSLNEVLVERGVILPAGFMDHSLAWSISSDGLYVLGDVDTVVDPTLWYAFLGVGQTLGDTDNDGDVDLADLNNVRNNFGGAGLGDTEGNGTVDLADLNNVRNHFGESVPVGNPVPEPAAFALSACFGLALAIQYLRRSR